MEQFEHAIDVVTMREILSAEGSFKAEESPRVLFCGGEGTCFFDDAPNPYVAAIVKVLDRRGEEGWILAQVLLREDDMICFWRRPKGTVSTVSEPIGLRARSGTTPRTHREHEQAHTERGHGEPIDHPASLRQDRTVCLR